MLGKLGCLGRMATGWWRGIVRGRGWCTGGKRKYVFRKRDMPGNMNTARNKVQTTIALVFVRIAKKHTRKRTRRKFVVGDRGSIWKTETTEDAKLGVIWLTKEKRVEGGGVRVGFRRTNIE